MLTSKIKVFDSVMRHVDHKSAEYVALRASIRQNGICTPLLVTEEYRLLHGYSRLAIARELRLLEVPIRVYPRGN